MVRILFTGGGTGGHIYPIIACARALKDITKSQNVPLELNFAGASDFDTSLLEKEGIAVYRVPSGKLRRYASFLLPWDIIKFIFGFFYAWFLLWWIMPDVIFGKGGYGSFAVAFVGRFYLIPLLIHESDSIPGLVNRLLGKIATRVALSFPETAQFFNPTKSAFVGNPTRLELTEGSVKKAQALLGIKGGRPAIFILGGSQGAIRINDLIAATLHELLSSYEVIHQCGQNNVGEFTKTLKELYGIDAGSTPFYHLKGFFNEEEEAAAFAIADLIISRGGAGSIYEIALAGKPSLLIPLPEAAFDHQRQNAFSYARSGAALVIGEDNLTPHILLNEIQNILKDPDKITQMKNRAKEFAKPDAARKMAEELLELAVS